jgi:hypothetical protein
MLTAFMPKPYGKKHIASTHDCQGRKREASSRLQVNAELIAGCGTLPRTSCHRQQVGLKPYEVARGGL